MSRRIITDDDLATLRHEAAEDDLRREFAPRCCPVCDRPAGKPHTFDCGMQDDEGAYVLDYSDTCTEDDQ